MSIPEFELWPECRWGIFQPPHPTAKPEAKPFPSAKARDGWVAQNPSMRRSTGKRDPIVKAYRQSLGKLDNCPRKRYNDPMSKTYPIPDRASSADFSIDRYGETIDVTVYGVVYRAPASEGGGFYVEDVFALDGNGEWVWLTAHETDRASEAILRQNS